MFASPPPIRDENRIEQRRSWFLPMSCCLGRSSDGSDTWCFGSESRNNCKFTVDLRPCGFPHTRHRRNWNLRAIFDEPLINHEPIASLARLGRCDRGPSWEMAHLLWVFTHVTLSWNAIQRQPSLVVENLTRIDPCSRSVVAIGSYWPEFHVSPLAAARTALLLPGPCRRKFASASATCTQTVLTISRLSRASPQALKAEMTHLLRL
jgi:hypothetical protein